MKKQGLIITVTMMLLTGCFHQETTGQTDLFVSDSQKLGHLMMITEGELHCSSENGYYYVAEEGFQTADGVFAYNMMYMDYDTHQEIYLCNRPGCKHKTVDCPSVFTDEEIQAGSSLFFVGEHLYLFSHAPDQDGMNIFDGNEGNGIQGVSQPLHVRPAVIYQMNRDGTERRKVFEYNPDEVVEDTVLSDGSSLFIFTKKLTHESLKNAEKNIRATERKLIKINMNDWTMEDAIDIDTDYKMIGNSDEKIVFSKINCGEKKITGYESNDEFLTAYQNSNTEIKVLDINRKEIMDLLTLPNTKLHTFAVGNRHLYYSSEGTNKIYAIDLDHQNEFVFKETSANAIDGIYDDVLLCSQWYDTNTTVDDISMHFIHFSDQKEDVSDLKQSVMGNRIIIRNELTDKFLVVYDCDAQLDTQYDNQQYTINGLKYGLILKDDLYTGKANYETIQMIGFGE